MKTENAPEGFNPIARLLHWVMALLIFILLSVGFFMGGMEASPVKFTIYGLHKSFGTLVLFLAIARVVWLLKSPRPAPLHSYKKWEVLLSKAVHIGLYICMILMPLAGWAMSSAGGFPAQFFGLFSLPPILPKNEALFDITREMHEISAFALLAMLALHFGGAFKHHFLDHDTTLQRMVGRKVGVKGGIALAAVAGILWILPIAITALGEEEEEGASSSVPIAQSTEQAKEGWSIILADSTVGFEATQKGEAFTGKFTSFGGKIIFDPARLDEAYADIWIDIASIETGSLERDTEARGSQWFGTSEFPRAVFVADSFSENGPNQYIAHGALTIRGKVAKLDLPFTLQIKETPDGQMAFMQGEATLNRLDFGIGQGQWQATDTIGGDVKITISLRATAE
ncbi:MAG: cytochrome b/b6 domain-containing protein [Alphaproteobacteria bacterium]